MLIQGCMDQTQRQIIEFSNLQCYEQQMSCYDLFLFFRRLCSRCFRGNQRSKVQPLEEPLIQISEPKRTEQNIQMVVFQQIKHNNLSPQNTKQLKEKHQIFVKQTPKSPVYQEEFHSIDSSYCFQTDKSIKSMKKLESQLGKLQIHNQSKRKEKKKSIMNISGQWQDTPIVDKLNVQDQIQQVKDWFKRQYGKTRLASFRVNHAVKLRMQGQGMLNLLVHKLQDFKIKFMGQSMTIQPKYSNKSKTLTFQHLRDENGQTGFKRTKILKYFQIKSHAPTLQQIIRAFISKQAMKILHGFISIQPVQQEAGNMRIPFPILQVKQNGSKALEERMFHLASQIGESKESKQQERQLVFVCYKLDESQQSWHYAIRISFGFVSLIELYSQSFEDINPKYQGSLKEKFSLFQKYLENLNIISIY